MATGKKSIIIYADWINKFEELEDDEAGRLIKHFFRYVNDMNPVAPDRITKLSFIDIQQSLKRDLVKWENRAERSRENGKLGGRPPLDENPKKPKETQQVILEPRKPDSVNVSVSVNGNVSEIKNSINDRKLKFSNTLTDFVSIYGQEMINRFFEYWTEPNKSNTKFRQELEKTWDNARRLKTWSDRDSSFKNGSTQKVYKSLPNNNWSNE